MRPSLAILAAVLLAGCVAAVPPAPEPGPAGDPSSTEPPPGGTAPPEWPQRVLYGSGERQVRAYLEDVVGDRFGRDAWRIFLAAPVGIAVASLPGRWATSHAPSVNLLVRTERGWIGRRGGRPAPVGAAAARELDRLLASRRLWAEPGRHPAYACPDAGADVVMIRHGGRTRTAYRSQGCGTPDLSSRLIAVALREALPD